MSERRAETQREKAETNKAQADPKREMAKTQQGTAKGSQAHADRIFTYLTFHLGLYVATPPLLALLNESTEVKGPWPKLGLVALLGCCLVSGVVASYILTTYLYDPRTAWEDLVEKLRRFRIRFLVHHLYWIGLLLGVGGTVIAMVAQLPR